MTFYLKIFTYWKWEGVLRLSHRPWLSCAGWNLQPCFCGTAQKDLSDQCQCPCACPACPAPQQPQWGQRCPVLLLLSLCHSSLQITNKWNNKLTGPGNNKLIGLSSEPGKRSMEKPLKQALSGNQRMHLTLTCHHAMPDSEDTDYERR